MPCHRRPLAFGIAVSLFAMTLLSAGTVAKSTPQATNGSSSQVNPTTRTPPLTAEEKEAQFHYKVALTALKNNDLEIATKELEKAASLAPNNALVQYNLAVVKSKSKKPGEALVNLKRAIGLGLPSTEASQADDLLVSLTYEIQKNPGGALSWLKGTWVANFDSRIHIDFKNRNGWIIGCFYPMAVTSTLTVTADPDHPDSLGGTLTLHARRSGDVDGGARARTADCISTLGDPAIIEDATYTVTSVTNQERDSSNNPLPGDTFFWHAQIKDCGSYCGGWDVCPFLSPYTTARVEPSCTTSLSQRVGWVLRRVDDSHLEPMTGISIDIIFGNSRLTKQD